MFTNVRRLLGVHEMAEARDRVVISGHAGNVGIVGWSLGGGHSQLGPLHGLGVDQVLEVEMVGADGSVIITNENGTDVYNGQNHQYIANNDLFWALRGGGGGTWGVLTAMTIKIHRPRNECKSNCYTQWQATWRGEISKGISLKHCLLLGNRFDLKNTISYYMATFFLCSKLKAAKCSKI